jgi:hypothetical protein
MWTDEFRIRSGFLFFPKKINGVRRWWVTTSWEEQYYSGWSLGDDVDGWFPVRWMDGKKRKRPFNDHWYTDEDCHFE